MQMQPLRRTLEGRFGVTNMKGLESIGTRAFYRPTGQITFEQGIEMGAAAIRTARNLGLLDLLLDSTGVSGFEIPDAIARYRLGASWAAAAGPQFRVALVVKQEFLDRQKIAAVVMQNRNAIADVFASEAEALAWLDARRPSSSESGRFPKR
jgi:hypothetical protein